MMSRFHFVVYSCARWVSTILSSLSCSSPVPVFGKITLQKHSIPTLRLCVKYLGSGYLIEFQIEIKTKVDKKELRITFTIVAFSPCRDFFF